MNLDNSPTILTKNPLLFWVGGNAHGTQKIDSVLFCTPKPCILDRLAVNNSSAVSPQNRKKTTRTKSTEYS
jgi:hypothetical protein